MLPSPTPGRHAVRCARLVAPLVAPVALLAVLLGGCSSEAMEAMEATEPRETDAPPAGFAVRGPDVPLVLVEGDTDALRVPLTLERDAGHERTVTLTLEGVSEADVARIEGAPGALTLEPGATRAELGLRLAIDDLPILPGERRFLIAASDGERTTRTEIEVRVEPVDAPDVYLLIGQSNMVGSSGDGTRRAGPGGPDEPHPRIRQLNVSPNDSFGLFTSADVFRSPERNIVAPSVTLAEDPLHVPRGEGRGEEGSGKGADYIGLGLSFAKSALAGTSREIVLVPAAWSGSAFCDNENDPLGQWNASPSEEPVLGNTLLFDRALVRIDAALAETGGILRGILWHQGESDANLPCAALYGDNVRQLAEALRTRIAPDPRGAALRAPDARIPFVVGTMSRGVDERGDYSSYNAAKRMIDGVHRTIGTRIAHAAVSVHDDLVPANGYPCGIGDCIHFGPEALREMGARYHAALREALAP